MYSECHEFANKMDVSKIKPELRKFFEKYNISLNPRNRYMYVRSCVRYNNDGDIVVLNIANNNSISEIPYIPSLEVVTCYNCPNLISISSFPRIESIDIRNCNNLLSISNMPNLKRLSVSHAYKIKELSNLPEINHLKLEFCYNLRNIDCIDSLNEFIYRVCPKLKIDQNALESNKFKFMRMMQQTVSNNIKKWQSQNLMTEVKLPSGTGHIVWKHVSPKCVGNLGFQYEIGKEFTNDGMACAGPFGAVREYDKHKYNSHLIAICAFELGITHHMKSVNQNGKHMFFEVHDEIFHVYHGVPLAMYRVSNQDQDGMDLALVQGVETPELLKILYS